MTDYALATRADDAALRQLLRENPMPGWVALSTEREPDYFAGANRYGRDYAVIARERDALIGMYTCALQPLYVNGAVQEVGYLGALRVAHRFRHRLRLVRDGYASIGRLVPEPASGLWFTAIAEDNHAARRLLEAGLPGMPRYRPLGDMLTLALPRARGRALGLWREAREEDLPELATFLREQAAQRQLAPAFDALAMRGLGARFHVWRHQGAIAAVMALWDQRACKQVVARGYRAPLGQLRPAYNAWARLARRVTLPKPGEIVSHCFIATFYFCLVAAQEVVALLRDALARSPAEILSLGLNADSPLIAPITRAFKPACYRTTLYAVSFDDAPAPALDGRPIQPEIALL